MLQCLIVGQAPWPLTQTADPTEINRTEIYLYTLIQNKLKYAKETCGFMGFLSWKTLLSAQTCQVIENGIHLYQHEIEQLFFFPPFFPSLHFKTPQIYLVTPLKVGKKNKGAAGLPVHVLRMMQWSMMGLQLTVISKQWCALWCWADLSSGLNCSSRDKNNCHLGVLKKKTLDALYMWPL